jgi:3'(2'), 5'-bisphosphate nucleotidase
MQIRELIETAVAAALGAGKEILEVYETAFDVEMKEDRTPLTQADKRSHQFITDSLAATGIPVLSEEGRSIPFAERAAWNRLWLVDPLDGTKEFIRRNGEFTVNIALIENQKPIAGVIYVPVADVLYFGSIEEGSYMVAHASQHTGNIYTHSVRIPVQDPNRAYTVVASRSHLSPETETFVSGLKAKHGEVQFLSKGSSLKICLVAEGKADVYPRLAPTMEWDTAAGHAIASGAGYTVQTWPAGGELIYNKEDLLNPFFVVSAP